ncbi:MAG TPA: HlyC/CorC family transporter, partial [Fervidobacterium sp.]|nr:HlyC/CorC family transporter [Fervidobacterium sp.]
MEDPLSYLWNILAIVFLLMLSAFFSASETALTSVSRFKLRNLVKNKES